MHTDTQQMGELRGLYCWWAEAPAAISRSALTNSAGGVRISQRFQMHRSGELRRLRTEVHLQNILPARRHQSVQFRRGVLLPVRPRREDNRARFVDVPLAPVALTGRDPAVMSAPAMPHYFQMKAWRTAQIGFEGQRFFLPVPAADQPLNRQSARPKFHRHARILKPTGREMQPRLQAGSSQPVGFQDASLAGARGLHPAQCSRAFFSIVGGKHDVPQPQNGNRATTSISRRRPTTLPLDAHGTSEVADEARGNRPRILVTCQTRICCGNPGANCSARIRVASSGMPTPRYNGGVPLHQFARLPAIRLSDDITWSIDQDVFSSRHFLLATGTQVLHAAAWILHASGNKHDLRKQRVPSNLHERQEKFFGKRAESSRHCGLHRRRSWTRAHRSYHYHRRDSPRAELRRWIAAASRRRRSLAFRRMPLVELETAVDNVSALSFYKRHGYSVIGTFPRYYSNGVDALILRKDTQQDLQNARPTITLPLRGNAEMICAYRALSRYLAL